MIDSANAATSMGGNVFFSHGNPLLRQIHVTLSSSLNSGNFQAVARCLAQSLEIATHHWSGATAQANVVPSIQAVLCKADLGSASNSGVIVQDAPLGPTMAKRDSTSMPKLRLRNSVGPPG